MPVLNKDSLFSIVQLDKENDWDCLAGLTEYYLTPRGLGQLKTFLGSVSRSIIIEKSYIDKDYRDTYSNFYSKKFAHYPDRTFRLHFFSNRLTQDSLWQLKKNSNAYLGFTVIRPTRVNCIGRSVFNPCRIPGLHGCLCLTEYKVHLLGHELALPGFPWISQDTDVTVCAHAAAWMVFRYFSERYHEYAEIYPFEISQLTSDYSFGRLVPSRGLTISQLAEIFSRFGFYPQIYTKKTFGEMLFYRTLYYYIESGIPVVAGMHGKEHALTVLGHISDYTQTFNSKRIHSADFLNGMIVNDDNFMPYQRLLKGKKQGQNPVYPHSIEDLDNFIVPLYEKIYLSAEHVDSLFAEILAHSQLGLKSLSPKFYSENMIMRIYLTSSKSFKMFREQHPPAHHLKDLYLQLSMPKFIWVCELSTPKLYPNQVVGEILWDATASHKDRYSFILIHYPEHIIINDRDSLVDSPERFSLNRALPGIEAYDIYRNNLKEIVA